MKVAVPADVRARSALPRIDYEDCFAVETESAEERTAEEWARVLLERSPAATRTALRSGWFSLGLDLGSTGDGGLVLGWPVRRNDPDCVLLAASSRLGFEAEVFCKRQQHELLAGTLMQLKRPLARRLWAGVAPGHRQVVRRILEQGSRR
jgi:hypothetical protein